jgi:hypothetical protein
LKKNQVPLDLAGQVVWMAWTLQELPIAMSDLTPLLEKALKLGGIQEFRNLRYRKAKGQPVFGQVETYPQASANDTEALIKNIRDRLSNLPAIVIPDGDYMQPGPNWESLTIPISEVEISETRYTAPLDINQNLEQAPVVHQ